MHIIEIDPGREVQCDFCGDDFTDSDAKGGLLFGSRAVCPSCVSAIEADAKRYGEEEHIRAHCPDGKSFANWVREDLR